MKRKNFLCSRKGTAEVIGTIMFVMILLFFFTEVYVWHDSNVKEMNDLYVKKMNAGMQINYFSQNNSATVTATGSDVTLSRLWIDTNSSHVYANLEPFNIHPEAGDSHAVTITFINDGNPIPDGAGGFYVNSDYDQPSNTITIHYLPQDPTVTIVNTLGIATSS